ncbi:hypothetical protein [Brevibacillus sp. NRS-1366]|uniref:hypothetical protein n=1 Tax=Brevibacillus sp. NRS-1366 TaxID=3233899 RepID=UPI003D1E56ED
MKTSVNVMGIQAKDMLDCIAATLKAVMRTGKEQKTIQVIGEESTEEQPSVFTARDAVFYEERLLTEIPEPNFSPGLLVHPKVLAEKAIQSADNQNQSSARRAGIRRPIRQRIINRGQAKVSRAVFPQVESKQPRDIRDFRSSLSPPVETVT